MGNDKNIVMASDHAGFELKEKLKQYLLKTGYQVKDMGTDSTVSVDYPDYISKAAEKVSMNEIPRGVVLCGSGVGASIVANKFPNVRAALVANTKDAALSRIHNNANVLVLGARSLPLFRARKVLKTWLETPFTDQDRHLRRIKKINEIEKKIGMKILPLILFLSLLMGSHKVQAETWSWTGFELDKLEKQNVILEKTSTVPVLRSSWDKPVADGQFDLFLDFNIPEQSFDRTGHYAITGENLYRGGNVGFRGNNPGGFVMPGNIVTVGIKPADFLDNTKDLESFTLSFWLLPLFNSGERAILTKGAYSGKKFCGLKIFQSGRRLVFRLENMFYNTTNTSYTFEFRKGTELDTKNWKNYCLSFDKTTGKLILYSGADEVSVQWATITGGPESEILTPRFTGSSSLLTIGGDKPFGYLGDLFISRTYFDTPRYASLTTEDQPEVFTGLLKNPYNNSKISEITLNNGTENERFEVFLRTCQDPFDPSAVKPFWKPATGPRLSGRFFQVKVVLKDDPMGKKPARLFSMKIRTDDMYDISPPSQVTLTATNSTLKIEWDKPIDRRIRGYMVYIKDNKGWSTKFDAGDVSFLMVTDMKDRQEYTVQVSSYDDAVPPDESLLSREQKIFFLRSDIR
jgi:ribose 5-phosphate isomerase B